MVVYGRTLGSKSRMAHVSNLNEIMQNASSPTDRMVLSCDWVTLLLEWYLRSVQDSRYIHGLFYGNMQNAFSSKDGSSLGVSHYYGSGTLLQILVHISTKILQGFYYTYCM